MTQENIMRSVWDGGYTEEQAGRGERTYAQACAACHLDTIRATMPQGAPASLSPRAYADIAVFLLSVNDYPAGDEELEPDVPTLEQIRIESQRP